MKKLILFFCCIISTTTFAQKWTKKADIASARDAAISFTLKGKIYFGSGGSTNDFWCYNPDSNSWARMADIPNPNSKTSGRGFGIGFAIGDKGYAGTGSNDSLSALYKDFWMYDPDSNKWTRKADYPAGRDALGSFVIGNKAYVGGGTDNNYIYGEFYEYNPATDKWTSKGSTPTVALAFPMSFVIGDKGYFACGSGTSSYKFLYQYDTTNNSWTRKADFPDTARDAGIGFAINNKGYAGLGEQSFTVAFSSMYEYDPTTDQWTKLPSMPEGPLAWPTVAVLNNKAYIGGGWGFGPSFSSDWYEFTADTTTGIETQNQTIPKISLYPNPANNMLNLQLPENEKGIVSILEIEGKNLMTINAETKNLSIDISSLPKGFYIISYQNEQGVANTKFIKE